MPDRKPTHGGSPRFTVSSTSNGDVSLGADGVSPVDNRGRSLDRLGAGQRTPASGSADRNVADAVPLWELATLRTTDALALMILLIVVSLFCFGAVVGPSGLQIGYVEVDALPTLGYRPRIDLNRSDWPELCLLPGISETLAKRIVTQREQLGGFHTISQLELVHGIGPVLTKRLQPMLFVSPADEASSSPLGVDFRSTRSAAASARSAEKARLGAGQIDGTSASSIIRSLE